MKPRIVEVRPSDNGRVYNPADIDMASGRQLGMISWPNARPGRLLFDGTCAGVSPFGHKCCLPGPHVSYCTAVVDSDFPQRVLNI